MVSSTTGRTSTSLAVVVTSALGFAACSAGAEVVASTDTPVASTVEETSTAEPESQPEPEPESEAEPEPESDESAIGLGGDHAEVLANAPAVIAEISATLTTEVLNPADANCSYLDQEDSAATRLNNWRIGRDEFLGVPHDVTLSERQEQRSLVEITSDYGYTEETLLTMAEILHTECHNRAFEAGDMSEQQANTRASAAIANFEELMNSVPDDEGRGAGTRTDEDQG